MFSHLSHLNALSLITGLFADISDELIRFFLLFQFFFFQLFSCWFRAVA